MRTPRLPSLAVAAGLVCVLSAGSGADAASLKQCKRMCGPSIQADCQGLRKGRLRKCRKRIWKACRRDETTCQVVTPTSTTLAAALPTSTTTTTSSTTTTLPVAALAFVGAWDVAPVVLEDGCALGADPPPDVLEIRAGATGLAAALRNIVGALFEAELAADGDLLLAAELPVPSCLVAIDLRLEGPLEPATQTTTGDGRITQRCAGAEPCETHYALGLERRPDG
jgi:hypothetical protein